MPRRPLLVGLAVTLAACGSSTAPPVAPKLADAARTAAQLSAVGAPFTTAVFQSFELSTPYFTAVDSASAVSPYFVAPLHVKWRGGQGVRTAFVEWRAGQGVRTTLAAFIPSKALGKTFVWDTLAQRYVASTETGAPANGARFDLYTLTPTAFPAVPSRPLATLGYTDLIDASTAAAATLGIALVGTQGPAHVTYASYTVTVPTGGGGGAAQLSLAGYVSDGTTELDLTGTSGGTLSSFTDHITADIAAQDAHMVETLTVGTGSATALAIDFSLSSGSETLDEAGTLTVDTVAAADSGKFTVTLNGRPFATVRVDNQGPHVAAAPGVTLDGAAQNAVEALFLASFELFLTEALLELPALELGVPGSTP